MPETIKATEITHLDSVRINFGFTGISEKHARTIIRSLIHDGWPESERPKQCVYAIRLYGEVAVSYPIDFSPVLYIGQGDAYTRLHNHSDWLSPLLMSIPQLSVEVKIAKIRRRNNAELYKHIEADLIRDFLGKYGAIPWFNKRREISREGVHSYEPDADRLLATMIGVGSGNKFAWAIQPTRNNKQHYERYSKRGDGT